MEPYPDSLRGTDSPVIRIEHVTKAYRLWERPAARLLSPLLAGLARLLPTTSAPARWLERRAAAGFRDFYALQDISLSVARGEAVGIVGRNGSGKSTLLQLIAGTLQPTTGSIAVHGRVAALLELGSGFNPEFTGRENVYLNGAVLGLPRAEIDARFDAIAAFADIGDFLDQPAKTYSSGMLVRLAFAVQTAVEPDLLIVDEALAVGDEAFQRKCFGRIEELKARGTTLLFVSHSANQVVELCSRAILLAGGRIAAHGAPKEVITAYHQQIYGRDALPAAATPAARPDPATHWAVTTTNPPAPADDSFRGDIASAVHAYPEAGARVSRPHLVNARGEEVNHLRRGHWYHYTYDVTILAPLHGVRFGAAIKTPSGVELAGMVTHRHLERLATVPAGRRFRVRFKFLCRLLPGTYFLNAGALALDGSGTEYFAHRLVDACMFRVQYEADLPVNALADLLLEAEVGDLTDAPPAHA